MGGACVGAVCILGEEVISMKNRNTKGQLRLDLKGKAAIGFFLLSLVLILGISFLSYQAQKKQIFKFYEQKAGSSTLCAAAAVDGDLAIQALEDGAYSPELQKQLRQMDAIKAATGAKYLYLFTTRGGKGYTYIYTAYISGDSAADMMPLGGFQPYEGGSTVTDQVVESGKPSETNIYQDTQWGYIANCFAPVKNAQGDVVALVGADYDMHVIMSEVRFSVLRMALAAAALILVLMTVFLLLTQKVAVRPLRLLTKRVVDFVHQRDDGGALRYEKIHLLNRDEIGDLAGAFNQMAADLQTYVSELAQVTAEKERIETELNVAKRIQEMFLPRIFPPYSEHDGFSLFADMQPAKEVGGDFYDFYPLDQDHFCVTVADVSGKGVPAALFMVVAKTVLKNLALAGASPAAMLEEANNQLAQSNEENMFVTVFTGILEVSTGQFTYANAGHNLPVLCRKDGTVQWLPCSIHLVLAAMEGIPYTQSSVRLVPGDRLLLYTDGVSEAMDPAGVLFGDERLLRMAQEQMGNRGNSVRAGVENLFGAVHAHAGVAPQSDDITILGLQYDG